MTKEERQAAFVRELAECYRKAESRIDADTCKSVALSLSESVPCRDDEIVPMFREARKFSAIPLKKDLAYALAQIRKRPAGIPDDTMTFREYVERTGDKRLYEVMAACEAATQKAKANSIAGLK